MRGTVLVGLHEFEVYAVCRPVPGGRCPLDFEPPAAQTGNELVARDIPSANVRNGQAVVIRFEPADMLQGILMLAEQVLKGESRVEIQYSRVVRPEGNLKAQAMLARE